MVAIFVGSGAGFVRGSGNVLGGAGQLGSDLLGRGGESVSVNATTGNLLISHQDEFLVGRGPDIGISRTYNSLGDAGDGDNGDNWQQSTTRRVFGLTGAEEAAGSTVSRLGADGSVVVYSWDAARSAYVTSAGSGAYDTLTLANDVWTWRDGDSQATESYAAFGADNWRIVSASDIDGNTLTFSYAGDKLDKVTTADGAWTQYVWADDTITEIVTGYTDLATSSAKTLTRTRYAYDAQSRLIMVTSDLSPEDNAIADGKTYVVTYTYDGTSNRVASIAQTDGSLLELTYDASGRVLTLSQTAASGDIRVTGFVYGTGFTEVTGPDGLMTRLDYDAAGQLTAITAPPASTGAATQVTQFAYDAAGNVTSVTDPRGKVTSYQHDANSNVIKVTDANGNVVDRVFDAANRLITEITNGLDQAGTPTAQYSQFAYDAEGHLRFSVNAAGQLTEYFYFSTGERKSQRVIAGHVFPVSATSISEASASAWRDSLGDLKNAQITTYEYDARGNLLQEAGYGISTETGDTSAADRVVRVYYTYDQHGQLLSRYRPDQSAETFTYDGLGRLIRTVNLFGGVSTIVFNDAALTTSVTSALGHVSVTTYNKAGDLISRTDSGANSVTGTASFQYDANGRLRIAVDASGRTTYVVYDKVGRKIADVNQLGEIVAYRYDLAGRLISTTRYAAALSAAQLALLADPDGTVELDALLPTSSTADLWSWTIYDDGGRVLQTIGSDGSVAGYEYDQSDRLLRTSAYYTRLTQSQIDALKLALPSAPVAVTLHTKDAVTRLFYDKAGQLIGTLDGKGYLTEHVYDGAGNKLQDIAYATQIQAANRANGSFAILRSQVVGTSTVDRTMRYVYDSTGRLRFTIDAGNAVTEFAYNASDQLTVTTQYALLLAANQTDYNYAAIKSAVVGSSADHVSHKVYDADGKLTFEVDAEGGVVRYVYDAAGNIIRNPQFVNTYSGARTYSDLTTWAALPAQVSGKRFPRDWYNARGEVLYHVDSNNYVRGYTYDADGRILSESAWPNAIVTNNSTLEQIAALAAAAGDPVTISYSYDAAGRLLTTTDGAGIVTRHVYNALGQLTDTYLADNVVADTVRRHFEYDAAGRVVADYEAYGSAQQIVTRFAYDGLGNRISTTDANGNVTTFAFDTAGQVTSATNALSGTTVYEYDAFGNVLKVTDPKGNASFNYYDKLNRVIAARDAAGYVTRTTYSRFSEVLAVERYSVALPTPGQSGVAVFDPLLIPTDPFAYADNLQAIADGLDAQADQAEAQVPIAQTSAAAAVQAASDADALVANLQAQIAALGGPQPIDFSAERAAVLADAATWMTNRRNWLNNAYSAVRDLYNAAPTGAYKDELNRIRLTLESEGSFAGNQSSSINRASYINKFYDNLTIQRSTLSADKAGALVDQMVWLQARKTDLVNWITQDGSVSTKNLQDYLDDTKVQWLSIVRAIYDLANNTYSTGWPTTTSDIASFYTAAQANPTYLPSGIQHTTSYAADYRVLAFINAFYDTKAVINDPYGAVTAAQQQAQQLQTQLATATADAAAAHTATDTAAAAVSTAQTNATQARSDAVQAQAAADAAYADALANAGGPVLADDFVLLDLSQLGTASATRFGYDKLGRATWKVDAENYVELYAYNAFGQQTALTRYAGQIGVGQQPNVNAAMPQSVTDAYALAALKQNDADAAVSAAAQVAVDLAAVQSNPKPWFEARVTVLQAQHTPLSAQLETAIADYETNVNHHTTNWWNNFRQGSNNTKDVALDQLRDQVLALSTEIATIQAAITRLTNGQSLTSAQQAVITDAFNLPGAQQAATAAQALADQALLDAQVLKAQAQGLNGTPSVTQFQYDMRGQVTKVTDAEGYFESFGYDAYGRRISYTDKSSTASKVAGATTTYAYDKRGLLVSETLPVASYTSAGTVQAASVTNSYTYDARGNLITKIAAQGLSEQRRTDFTYDKPDRLVKTEGDSVSGLTINASTKAVSTVSGKPTETLTYDANGNVITSVDAAGAKTVFFYDALNRKAAEVNALGAYTAYEYDADGNVTRVRAFDALVAQPASGGTAAQAPAVPSGAYRETTFTYDSRNQVLTSNVLGVTTGQASGSSWVSAATAITTSYQYDADGNVVKVTDPNGKAVWSYYDKLGRKISQVDAGNYLTKWTYNAEGNVTEERRYATAVAAPTGTATLPAGTNHADDRITQYTYDKNGNRLSEARLNVQYHNGSGGYSTGTATIAWLYNGLGQVTRRTEATGDQTNYTYDGGGRLTREVKSQGAVDYFYDGTGNLIRNVQAAVNGTQARTTTYTYGAGGRLASMTDAAGYVHSYYYDVAGHTVLESYVRTNSAGTATTEAIGHRFDVLGHDLGQAYYVKSGTAWNLQSSGDVSSLEYNAHGEVARIGINGLWQQESKYDAAGRVWASNTGDGVWKYFGYDKNGNQTLSVTSAGTSLAGQASITAAYGQVSSATVNGTITAYDARNQAITVREEGRQLAASGSTELVTSRTYNAFGDVVSETAANNGITTFAYNTAGKLLTVVRPTVSITTEAGVTQSIAPTDRYYYDLSGRLTGQRDANSNLTRYTLLSGSGYGGSQALVSQAIHADGGTITTLYNAHGEATQVTDEVGLVSTMGYDNLGRLTQVSNPGGLIDYYSYDVLGQRLTHYNNLLGSTNKETTNYDIQGRITAQRAFGGDTTTTSYVWSSTIATAGMGTFGGWTETSTYANSKTTIDKSDLFGRTVQHTDMGGYVTDNTYDAAGRLITAATGPAGSTSNMAYVYYNTGQLKQSTLTYTTQTYYWTGTTVLFGTQTTAVAANYTYNALGNRLSEVGTTSINGGTATTWKNQSATYDALGRMKTWAEAGTTNSPASSIAYAYDAMGNIRRSTANYMALSETGVAATTSTTQDFWFRYDNMNRLVVDKGVLSGGAITRNYQDTTSQSREFLYDKAGRRTSVATTTFTYQSSDYVTLGYYLEQREIYSYNSAGGLSQVASSVGDAVLDVGTPITSLPAAPATGTTRADYVYDLMGRMTSQKDYSTDGVKVVYDRALTYNDKSQITAETAITKGYSDTYTSVNTYNYGSGTDYALGSVLSVAAKNYKNNNDSDAKDTSTTNAYIWRDGAVQSTITVDNDTGSSSNTPYTTTMYYNSAGRLVSAYINDGKPRQVAYTLDENAQIIRRDETRPSNAPSAQTGSPHEVWYRYSGSELGYVGNNGTDQVSYATSIAERQSGVSTTSAGTFRRNSTYSSSYADFAQTANTINSYSQGASGGTYTVRTGDTLQSVAQTVWGDSNLWYKLAEANGISSNAGLIEGQVLQLPAGVIRNSHNAGNVNPYDASEGIGDLSPTTPKPPKKAKGCGGLGMILIAVVAIAVTIVATAGATAALSGEAFGSVLGAMTGAGAAVGGVSTAAWIAGGAIGGAIGSMASQGVGIATGLQKRFSWKGVALAGISGAVGGYFQGLGNTAQLGASGVKGIDKLTGVAGFFSEGGAASAAARGVIGSVVTQGAAVATGLQSKFDFAGVAAAGVGAFASAYVGVGTQNMTGTEQRLLVNSAGAIANVVTRSAINGENFGDNLVRALPDVIGDTIGNMLADGIAGTGRSFSVGMQVGAGAGDGTAAQPIGDGQVRGSASDDAHPADIVVTARRGGKYNPVATVFTQTVAESKDGGDSAGVASVDRGNHPYPADPEDMSGNTAWQLRAKKAAYIDAVARSGQTFTDNELNVKTFDDLIALADAREAPNVAAADAEVNEILRAALVPVDIGVGGYNIAMGNGELRDYLAVASVVPVGKMLGTVGRVGETASARATRLGAEGEQAVGLFGPKVGIRIPGSDRLRIPDNLDLTTRTLTEVKNVSSQSYTRQLRDFAAYSKSKGLTFELYVRPSTRVSNTILQAQARGELILKFIPGAK